MQLSPINILVCVGNLVLGPASQPHKTRSTMSHVGVVVDCTACTYAMNLLTARCIAASLTLTHTPNSRCARRVGLGGGWTALPLPPGRIPFTQQVDREACTSQFWQFHPGCRCQKLTRQKSFSQKAKTASWALLMLLRDLHILWRC